MICANLYLYVFVLNKYCLFVWRWPPYFLIYLFFKYKYIFLPELSGAKEGHLPELLLARSGGQ